VLAQLLARIEACMGNSQQQSSSKTTPAAYAAVFSCQISESSTH
jgi:hypothetical protein